MNQVVEKVFQHLRARADLNGDGKIDAKDLESVEQLAKAEATQFVAERTPLGALSIAAISAFTLGVVLTRFLWPGC